MAIISFVISATNHDLHEIQAIRRTGYVIWVVHIQAQGMFPHGPQYKLPAWQSKVSEQAVYSIWISSTVYQQGAKLDWLTIS